MNAPHQESALDGEQYDPVYLNARREALIIFCVWAACLLWAVPYCYFNGYTSGDEAFQAESFATIWGVPSWVFWGIAMPWMAANVFTIWFCFFYMADDDLGIAHEGVDIEEEIAEMHAARGEAGQ